MSKFLRTNFPLDVYVNSSAMFFIKTPRKCLELFFKVGKADKSGYYEPIRCVYSPTEGGWLCCIPPVFLPIGGITQYKVVGRDANGYRVNIGQNILRIIADSVYDANENVNASTVRDCHIELDGKWYSVGIIESDGALTFNVSQEASKINSGYVYETGASPLKIDFKTPYSYNKETKTYHAVTAYRDDTGTVSASVDEYGEPEGVKSFCYDSATGFWYEMNSVVVDGEESLVVGDKR